MVVVGAGPAGCSTAYLLAKSGLKVLLLERGAEPGSKMLWGGKAYAQPIREVWPELDREAPIQRWVVEDRISVVVGERVFTVSYRLGRRVAFTAYLTQLVSWMAKKAEEAGALVIDKTRVDEIVVRDGRVVGVRSGADMIEASVVVDAEGVNRLLLERLGLVKKIEPEAVGIGVKEVLRLDQRVIENRFGIGEGEGVAWFVIGDVTRGIPGGGFIYTMRDTVSLGLVLSLSPAIEASEKGVLDRHVSELLEDFRLHPYFSRLWGEAEVVEYGGRMVIEGGLRFMPRRLYMPGLLVVGDAAGLQVNAGYTVRGVDMAVYSGKLAAEVIIEAFNKGRFDEEVLKRYEERVLSSYIYREMVSHRGVSSIMHDPFYFNELPRLLIGLLKRVYEADYEEPTLMRGILESSRENRVGIARLLYKLAKVVRSI